jgi:hypothetical protein
MKLVCREMQELMQFINLSIKERNSPTKDNQSEPKQLVRSKTRKSGVYKRAKTTVTNVEIEPENLQSGAEEKL